MANEVRFDIVAKDAASKTIDDVAGKAEHLEKLDPTVTVDADTGDANRDLTALDRGLSKLTDADKLVVLALRAGNTQNELAAIAADLATIDRNDPTIAVKLDNYQATSADLDALKAQMADIADTSVDPDVGNVAREKLDGVADSANNAKGAVHGMAGGAIGDFAATATGIGPLGEALGQLTEQAAAGESSLRQLAGAALGLGAISAGIVILNAVMGHFADAAERAAKIKAFNDQGVKDYTASILEAQAALDKLNGTDVGDPIPTGVNARMKDLSAQTIELIDAWQKAGKIEAFDPVADQIVDITGKLAQAGITAEQWAAAVINGGASINVLGAAARDAGLAVDTQTTIMRTAAAESVKYDAAQAAAADRNKVFATTTDDAAAAQRAQAAETARYTGLARQYQQQTGTVTDAVKGLTKATDDYTDSFREMSGDISRDQSLIDLANQFDDVRAAGQIAMAAQVEANKAQAAGAKDAAEKQTIATQAMRDYQTSVNNAKQSIIDIGATAGATDVEVDTALKAIDRGDLDATAAQAEAFYARNPVQVEAHLKLIAAIGAGLGRGQTVTVTGTSAPVTPTTVVNNYGADAHPMPALAAASAPARWARVNGRN